MVVLGPKMLTDANRKLVWVPSLADYHAPKVAELSAATVLELSCLITADNFGLGATGDAEINVPAFCASGNSTAPGRTNYTAEMNFFRFLTAADDKAWDTFTRKNIHGFLVMRIGQIADGQKSQEVPFKPSDKVQVYEAITGTPQILTPPANGGYELFKQMFHVQDQVDERAVVAGP